FLLAGHDTTAFALSAALHFLAQHQDVQEKLRKEVMDVMGITNYSNQKVEDAQCPTIEQTKQMEYLLAVMKETMRLYPSVPDLPLRTTSKDVVVDGYTIPANTDVLLSIYTLHHGKRG
ncbi:cytochrome P450, partial [Neoconidiobolus thromboides FSU 785]